MDQGGLVCCDSWGRKELDRTERLNWTELKKCLSLYTNWDIQNFIGEYFLIENKTSLKDTECRCKLRENLPWVWLQGPIVWNCQFFPCWSLEKLNAIIIKISISFFFKLNNLILKFIWKDKGQEIAKTFLKNRVRVTKSLKTPGYCGKRKQTKHVYKKLQECTFSSSSG